MRQTAMHFLESFSFIPSETLVSSIYCASETGSYLTERRSPALLTLGLNTRIAQDFIHSVRLQEIKGYSKVYIANTDQSMK